MTEKIVLEYKRVNVDKSTGRIVRLTDVGEDVLKTFESVEFKPMLRDFAEALQQCEDAVAVWKRTDRPGLVPYDLDPQITKLFRTDPVAAIESLCPPARNPSTTIKRIQEERKPVPVSIRAGYDVLADAFGEDVYSRIRTRTEGIQYVECPCCGLWTPVGLGLATSSFYDPAEHSKVGWSLCANPKCRASEAVLTLKTANDKWVAYAVTDLLATQATRFYMPRAWNDGRPWVTWKDLNEKYEEYVREKEKQP